MGCPLLRGKCLRPDFGEMASTVTGCLLARYGHRGEVGTRRIDQAKKELVVEQELFGVDQSPHHVFVSRTLGHRVAFLITGLLRVFVEVGRGQLQFRFVWLARILCAMTSSEATPDASSITP